MSTDKVHTQDCNKGENSCNGFHSPRESEDESTRVTSDGTKPVIHVTPERELSVVQAAAQRAAQRLAEFFGGKVIMVSVDTPTDS